ncbi:MAG TPA: NAD(P)H-dependent oxidoreductase [Bacteriovoracaceae bacterium]|nr:NAD(P)H-dependent oxidoreductase [Bacteriovoracaceae bacterium]
MKPKDAPKKSFEERPFRVLLISGSQRRQYNCPGVDSKSRMLMLRMAEKLPRDWEIDYEDLGNVFGRARIQSCNACVSTSMALCVWPCNCYEKKNSKEPDLMWDLDLYSRLDQADAWAIIGPVNWYGPTSNLKAMFDRLVCMNGGNPREELIEHKNPELAMKLEHLDLWKELSVNHLEGRSAAFFCYGDEGGDEIGVDGKPKILKHKQYFEPEREPFHNMRDTYAPLVWQCRYGGIEVPEHLWQYRSNGAGKKYSENQAEDMIRDEEFLECFDQWTRDFGHFVETKGKVSPGKYRAFGYRAPRHFIKDIKLGWRSVKMRLGLGPKDSSPHIQELKNLNHDKIVNTQKSDGERLRH